MCYVTKQLVVSTAKNILQLIGVPYMILIILMDPSQIGVPGFIWYGISLFYGSMIIDLLIDSWSMRPFWRWRVLLYDEVPDILLVGCPEYGKNVYYT